MARVIKKIKLTRSVDETVRIVENILTRHKYKNKLFKGENIWSKGDGVIIVMSCFAFSFSEDEIIIQAWIRDAVTGESDLEGFKAIAVKRKAKAILNEIENSLS